MTLVWNRHSEQENGDLSWAVWFVQCPPGKQGEVAQRTMWHCCSQCSPPTKYSFGSLLGSFPICTLTTNNSLPLMLAAASSCPNKIHELFGGDCCPVGYQSCWECRLSSCVPPLLPHASSHFLHCLLGRKKVYFPLGNELGKNSWLRDVYLATAF